MSQALGSDPTGAVTANRLLEASRSGGGAALRDVFNRLSSSDQALLRRRLGVGLEEIFSLSAESDPELFYAGIFSLGQRALRDGDALLSGGIFQGLAEAPEEIRASIPATVRERAQQEFNAMNGVGSVGRRFEYLARHFAREASDPGMILGMGVAGTVFSAMRLGVLSRLAVRPAAWWTRGLGAGMFASASAFPAEVLAFWGTTRAYSQAVRPETLRWDRASIGQELASLGLTLGFLKLFGAASGHAFDRVHGINPATGAVARLPGLTRFSRSAFQQLGTLGGIATGHYAEMRLGLRPHTSGDTFWTDSLVTLFQFHVGGRLSQTVMGPRHAARMQELALRTQSLELVRPESPRLWPPFGGELAMTAEGLPTAIPEREGPSRDHILMMSTTGPKPDRPSSPRLRAPTAPDNSRLEPPFKSLIEGLHNEELSVSERYALTRELSAELLFARELFGRMRAAREIPADGPKNLDAMIRDVGMARWEIPFTAVIQSLCQDGISATDRYQLSRELLEDLPIAREVYTKLRSAVSVNGGSPSSDRLPNLDALLYHLNIGHFELLSDRMHDWHGRFQFLQHELRGRVNEGSKPRRRNTRQLLESVQLKMLETRRYHNDAESYIADVKGPSPKSVFEATRYERLVQRFSDISARLERYIEGKPVLAKILSRYQSVVPLRRNPRPDFENLEAEIRRSPLSTEHQDLFFQAVSENDFLLTQYELLPVNLWLRELNAGGESRKSRRGWRGLGEYLEVAAETRNLLGGTAFRQWQIAHEKLMLSEGTAETAGPILQQILSARMSGDPTGLVNRFLAAVPAPATGLARFRPLIRASSSLQWPELRTQLFRLSERQYLTRDTVRGIMEWFDPSPGGAARALIHAIREEAVAGIIDFLRKGSHTPDIRRELSQFFEEVVRRKDQRMMAMLAVHFQNYQLGMMRDRLQIRAQPSKDVLSDQMAIEAYDRFLEAIRATSRFYVANPNVRGPYFDVFDKLEGGKESDNALLAAPILQRTQSLLQADASVELLNRGGLGEALLHARHADGTETTRSLSSVLDPLAGRAHLEMWLERAERELLHAGQYLNHQNGNHPLILDLQIPNIRPGVSKRDIALWSRDFLQLRPLISEIHLAIPERGSVAADPFDPADFRIERVTRSMPTTEALIENRERDLETRPEDVANRLELYRLRQEWAHAAVERNSEIGNILSNPTWREFLSDRIQEVEAGLTRLRAAEQAVMGPLPESTRADSSRESRPPDLTGFLQQIEHQNLRLQRFQNLGNLAEQISGFRDRNWELLYESARMFPRDPGVRSLVHRSVLSLFTDMEKRGGNSLTDDGALRRGKTPPYPLEWRRRTFLQAAEMLLGVPFDPARVPSLFNLSSAEYSVRDLRWSYNDRGLALQGDIVPDSGLETYESYSQFMLSGRRTEFPGEPDSGTFSFRMAREARSGGLHAHFDHLTMPPHLRGGGVGTVFFGELIALAREMKAATIATPDVSGDHRYILPIYGIRFRTSEDRAKLLSRFRLFLVDYMMKLPEFEQYDFSELSRILSPRDLALAHLDPVTRSLRLNAWESGVEQGLGPAELPDYHRVGRLFLLNDAPSFDGFFDLKDGSPSMDTFTAYLASRRGRAPLNPQNRQ